MPVARRPFRERLPSGAGDGTWAGESVATAILQLLGAVAIAGILIALALTQVDRTWVPLAGMTLFYFGLLLYGTRNLWKEVRYWAVFALFVLQCLVLFEVQLARPAFPMIYYAVGGPLEVGLIYYILLKATSAGPAGTTTGRHQG
jgi:hypothetical protein